jgi:bifunctional UDP-N-acetylglucosamine pyrophosphorylase/glucosamine-1-phosphate N-acetyltransferase
MKLHSIILAAGKGTRMKSLNNDISKVGYPILGVALVNYVLDATKGLVDGKKVVIVGHGGEYTKSLVENEAEIAWQHQQLGTGHAIMQTAPMLKGVEGTTLILCGDTPLLTKESLTKLVEYHNKHELDLTVLTATPKDPHGYGRIVRDQHNHVKAIVEQKDLKGDQGKINEVNAGVYVVNNHYLFEQLDFLNTNNASGELYLTDIIGLFNQKGYKVGAYILEDENEMLGTNDRVQLAEAAKLIKQRINRRHMLNGVTFEDPDHTYVGPYVEIGNDTVLSPGVTLLGKTKIGKNNIIGPETYLENMEIGDNNHILFAHLVDSKVGNENHIGPYTRFRGHVEIHNHTKIGNFVEFKKSIIKDGSKAAHLSYIGDTTLEENVNVGCGVITANYDGYNKFNTYVGKNVFLGSNATIVAPVTIEEDAFIAAGSTINRDVKKNDLAIARARQENKPGYATVFRTKAKAIKEKNKK